MLAAPLIAWALVTPASAAVAPAQAAGPSASVAHITPRAAPAQSCSTTSGDKHVTATVAHGKFVGNVTWGFTDVGKGVYTYIDVNGTLSSTHGTTTLFLHYKFCDSPHDDPLGSARAGHSTKISKNPAVDTSCPGFTDVSVYVCNDYKGYRCGASVG
jgi:hypothetical protein